MAAPDLAGTAYLDCAASTPMMPEAVEAMLPYLSDVAANPTGGHGPSRAARRAIDDARDEVADVLGVAPGSIVFCSGGTEADNLAVFGSVDAGRPVTVCSAVEHPAVLEPVAQLEGVRVGVDPRGVIDLDELAVRLDEHAGAVGVVSVMSVNNELGTIQPLRWVL